MGGRAIEVNITAVRWKVADNSNNKIWILKIGRERSEELIASNKKLIEGMKVRGIKCLV